MAVYLECGVLTGEHGTVNNSTLLRAQKYVNLTGDPDIDYTTLLALERVRLLVRANKNNDLIKHCLPEAYKTDLVSTWNLRSLQNFLSLRLSPHAMSGIREVSQAMYSALPEEHKFLFQGVVGQDVIKFEETATTS